MTRFGYARASDGAYIGYRVDGEGPVDLVLQPDWQGNVDRMWEDPDERPWLEAFASLGRLILHDPRGIGSSSRGMGLPNLETRVSDLLAVLDAVDASRPVLAGYASTGSVNILAAASHPDLARAIVWLEPNARYAWAPDYPWGLRPERLEEEVAQLEAWGTDGYEQWFADEERESGASGPAMSAITSRGMCPPDVAQELERIWFDTDVLGVLASVRTPTLLLVHGDRPDAVARAEYANDRLGQGVLRVMPGTPWTVEEIPAWLREIRSFIGDDPTPPPFDTVLATVLFTDIVQSTNAQAALGDRAWRRVIEGHHAIVRGALDRWRGVESDTAGDGFYATFDGPARAIRCAGEIVTKVRALGIEVRAGVHTGECEIIENKRAGLAVSIGARVMAHAGASEVLVSQTVKDLVAGSGLSFDDAGEYELKGVPDRWRLYRVATV